MIVQVIPAGDIEIRNGKTRLASGSEYLRLKILARHRMWKGEWFRDLREGFPWREIVLGVKSPDLEVIRAAYRRMLLTTPGVLSIVGLTLTPDYPNRNLGISFEVIGTDARIIVSPDDDAFVIPVPE